MLLNVKDIMIYYGNVLAVNKVSFSMEEGQLVGLVGPNGAGKSTLMRTISGLISSRSGTIEFKGERIDRLPAYKIARMGIVQCPEGRKPFSEMTVAENLMLGNIFCKDRHELQGLLDNIYDLFPSLRAKSRQVSSTLSGGEQQMLAIGRALMAEPKLLLIDELSLGLAPVVVDEIFKKIMMVKEKGMNILIVDQVVDIVVDVADNIFVLEQGRIVFSGGKQELLKDNRLREVYLGLV